MASAIFAVPFTQQIGPDFAAIGGETGLSYTDAVGVLRGGFSCIGNVPYPLPPNTCLVRVWASAERIAEMAAGTDYLFLEMVEEPEPAAPPTVPIGVSDDDRARLTVQPAKRTRAGKVQPVKPSKPTKAKAKAWLKAKGHKPSVVDLLVDEAVLIDRSVRVLHGVTDEQWQAAHQ